MQVLPQMQEILHTMDAPVNCGERLPVFLPVIEHIWDTNPILDENSTIGLILKALFGYNGNPSLTEAAAYVVYFAAIILGLRLTATQELAASREA